MPGSCSFAEGMSTGPSPEGGSPARTWGREGKEGPGLDTSASPPPSLPRPTRRSAAAAAAPTATSRAPPCAACLGASHPSSPKGPAARKRRLGGGSYDSDTDTPARHFYYAKAKARRRRPARWQGIKEAHTPPHPRRKAVQATLCTRTHGNGEGASARCKATPFPLPEKNTHNRFSLGDGKGFFLFGAELHDSVRLSSPPPPPALPYSWPQLRRAVVPVAVARRPCLPPGSALRCRQTRRPLDHQQRVSANKTAGTNRRRRQWHVAGRCFGAPARPSRALAAHPTRF